MIPSSHDPALKAKLQRFIILNAKECRWLTEKKEREALFALKPGVLHVAGLCSHDNEPHPHHKFCIHGMGAEFDALLRQFNAECAQRDIITTPYHCLFTLTRKQLAKHPEAEAWLTRDAQGKLLVQAYYEIPIRLCGCVNNPGWRRHSQDIVKYSIGVGFTANFYDNPNWFRCQCRYCQEKFDAYMQAKGRRPQPIPTRPDWESELWHEYYWFIADCIGELIGELSRYGKSLNPAHLTYINTQPPHLQPSVTNSMPSTVLNRHVDLVVYELGGTAPNRRNFCLTWNVASYSFGMAEAQGRQVVTIPYSTTREPDVFHPDYIRLGLMEGFAFAAGESLPDLMFMTKYGPVKQLKPHFDFVRQYGPELVRAEPVADVAIYASWENHTWYLAPVQQRAVFAIGTRFVHQGDLGYVNMCDIMAQHHVTFRTALALENLKTKVLVLPNIACLSKSEAAQIRKQVKAGMSLLATGETSLYDRLQKRKNYLLADVFGVKYPAQDRVRTTYGKGRVVFNPRRPEIIGGTMALIQLREDLDWLLKGGAGVRAVASEDAPFLLMTAFQNGRRQFINLLNYRIDDKFGIRPVEKVVVTVRGTMRSARAVTPDGFLPRVKVQRQKGHSLITVSKVVIDTLLIVES